MGWRIEEDALVENHVKNHGEGRWKKVADLLGRTENSCYQRWFNHLKPGIDHSDITNEEAIEIIHLHKECGSNQWAWIAKELSAMRADNLVRTGNKIKNFWNKTVKTKALELNLEVDTEYFVITMTNIFMGGTPPTTTFATPPPLESGGAPTPDFGLLHYDGVDYTTFEEDPPVNLEYYFNGSRNW